MKRSCAGAHAVRLAASIGRITERLTPQMLATFTFVAGVMLLFSGATPGEADRLRGSIECFRSA